jgi:uncharacterized membrane protein
MIAFSSIELMMTMGFTSSPILNVPCVIWPNQTIVCFIIKLQKKEKEKIKQAKKAWQATLEVFDSWG